MHELRSPLHGIIGLAKTLSQDESSFQKPLKMISQSAERVLEFVTNLMDYWNLSDDPTELVQDPIDMASILSETLARCESAVNKRGKPMKKDTVSLTTELSSNLPVVMGDQQNINSMLYHIIINALKFTHKGEVKISIMPTGSNTALMVKVEDSGIGIGKYSLDRVFLPFHKRTLLKAGSMRALALGLPLQHLRLEFMGGPSKWIPCRVLDQPSQWNSHARVLAQNHSKVHQCLRPVLGHVSTLHPRLNQRLL